MSERYFVFLYIEDKELEQLLNLAILALNPSEKWPAHVTLAGPYSDRKNLPRNLDYSRKVSVFGAGQFRSENQNTVFLRIGTRDLKDVWDKPDFPFNPHLTLYDGSDHELGDTLFNELTAIRPFFSFNVSKRYIVASSKGQLRLNFIDCPDPEILYAGKDLKWHDLRTINRTKKIEIAKEVLAKARTLMNRR